MMRQLLKGGDGYIENYGPWSKVQCTSQVIPGKAVAGYFAGDNPYTPVYALNGVVAGIGAGSCAVITDTNNPCHPTKLAPYFGSRAEDASRICNMESSGGQPIVSGTDRCCGTDGNCDGSKSFSGGYFQINILAHADKIPGCNLSTMYNRNGSTVQGNPIPSYDKKTKEGITVHTGWTCEVKNDAMYGTCMRAAIDPMTNYAVAKRLFDASGFQPWVNSARRCGVSVR
jgi:hypothetical protein